MESAKADFPLFQKRLQPWFSIQALGFASSILTAAGFNRRISRAFAFQNDHLWPGIKLPVIEVGATRK
jgi:hypothetical protein